MYINNIMMYRILIGLSLYNIIVLLPTYYSDWAWSSIIPSGSTSLQWLMATQSLQRIRVSATYQARITYYYISFTYSH